MDDVIAELLIKIGMDATQAEVEARRLESRLGRLENAGHRAGKGTDQAERAFKRLGRAAEGARRFAQGLAVGMTAVATAVAGVGRQVFDTAATFEKLKAQLKTATGSQAGAEGAFDFVRNFAKETPFQVEEVTQAFIKLKNLGLDPSEDALRSYGNTASAMGKSLDQFIEAIADASTGEFERLKEFGIKASKQGDEIAFRFRGHTTRVADDAQSISTFLRGIGDNNFAGAMAEQMDTLGGMVSNLKDSLASFFLQVAEMGPLEELKGLIDDINKATGNKDGLAKTLARVLTSAIKTLRRAIRGDLLDILKKVADTVAFVVENFDKLIFLFGAAKTLQAFNAAAAGLRSIGIAASASLGPIGAITAAFIALLPVAIDAGNAIGDALTRGQGALSVGATKERGNATVRAAQSDLSSADARRRAELSAEASRLSGRRGELEQESRGLFSGKKGALRQIDKQQRDVQRQLRELDQKAKKSRDTRVAKENQAAAAAAAELAAEQSEFGAFDDNVAQISDALGIDGEASSKQQQRLDRAIVALAEGKSLKEARKAAGLDRRRGGGGRRKKTKPKVTSPTTVSEFFAAASKGELGPIAARTPSTKEIEPTVAVDITNNNFSFNDTFHVKGQGGAKETADMVVAKIKQEFDRRTAVAGQQIATNVVR